MIVEKKYKVASKGNAPVMYLKTVNSYWWRISTQILSGKLTLSSTYQITICEINTI